MWVELWGRIMGGLTDREVRSLGQGRHSDGNGLLLVVSPTGKRSWVMRFQKDGVRRDMGLGRYPDVSLADARLSVLQRRKEIAQGQDPIREQRQRKKAKKAVPTFEEVAADVIKAAQQASTNAKVRYQWARHLGPAYCGPLLKRPINEITTMDVAGTLRPIWTEKPEVARKLLSAIRRVFDQARVQLRDQHQIEMGYNPANWADLKALSFERPTKLKLGNHPSLPFSAVPEFVRALRSRDAVAAKALEFLILTAVRTDTVLGAHWKEIDLDQAVWIVPLARLKDRKHRSEPFRVPLSVAAISLLREMQQLGSEGFVFPGQKRGKPLSNMAMLTVLRRMNNVSENYWIDPKTQRPITAHGFRSSFRVWAEEAVSFPHAVIEEAMGHQVGTEVERAYRRTDVLEQRRPLMQAWGNFVTSQDNVIAIGRRV